MSWSSKLLETVKPVDIKFTWHILEDDLSRDISSRYFITLILLEGLLS